MSPPASYSHLGRDVTSPLAWTQTLHPLRAVRIRPAFSQQVTRTTVNCQRKCLWVETSSWLRPPCVLCGQDSDTSCLEVGGGQGSRRQEWGGGEMFIGHFLFPGHFSSLRGPSSSMVKAAWGQCHGLVHTQEGTCRVKMRGAPGVSRGGQVVPFALGQDVTQDGPGSDSGYRVPSTL